ncbi:MAG TPA: hypothetical protein VF610_12375 [Segetibacter sp.]|jgi:hypothetical protein
MKNVLLPTDLTVQSLRPVHDIVDDAKGQPVTIHVVHFISMPSSITDLLFINRSKPFNAIPAKFSEAFQLLRNKYQGVVDKISFDFIFCSSSQYLNNFIEANNIEAVYMLKDYNYVRLLKQSENFLPCFNKCKVPVHKLTMQPETIGEYQNLSALLNGNEPLKTNTPRRKEQTAVSYS